MHSGTLDNFNLKPLTLNPIQVTQAGILCTGKKARELRRHATEHVATRLCKILPLLPQFLSPETVIPKP